MAKGSKPQNGSSPEKAEGSLRIGLVDHREEPADLSLNSMPDPKLEAAGWEKRFIADPMRAREAIQLYTELGFEVLAEPVNEAELDSECADCKLVVSRLFVTIYTRRPIQEDKGSYG